MLMAAKARHRTAISAMCAFSFGMAAALASDLTGGPVVGLFAVIACTGWLIVSFCIPVALPGERSPVTHAAGTAAVAGTGAGVVRWWASDHPAGLPGVLVSGALWLLVLSVLTVVGCVAWLVWTRPAARKSAGLYDVGDVVWAFVPFADDPSQGKDRPVAVVGVDRSGTLTAVYMTSNEGRANRPGVVALSSGDWDPQGRRSWADTRRTVRVSPDDVRRFGATLPASQTAKLVRVWRATRAAQP